MGSVLKEALEQKKSNGPAKAAPGQMKPQYANYYERKQDEELNYQKDVVKKGIIGQGLHDILHKTHQ